MSNAYNAFAKGVILLRATLFSCSFFASSEIRIISLLLILLGIFYMPFRHGIIKRQSCFCEYVKLKLYVEVYYEIIWLNNFDFREHISLLIVPYTFILICVLSFQTFISCHFVWLQYNWDWLQSRHAIFPSYTKDKFSSNKWNLEINDWNDFSENCDKMLWIITRCRLWFR